MHRDLRGSVGRGGGRRKLALRIDAGILVPPLVVELGHIVLWGTKETRPEYGTVVSLSRHSFRVKGLRLGHSCKSFTTCH